MRLKFPGRPEQSVAQIALNGFWPDVQRLGMSCDIRLRVALLAALPTLPNGSPVAAHVTLHKIVGQRVQFGKGEYSV